MKTKKTNNQHTVQIIAGEYRHRKISVVSAENLRPTSSRIRETLFNWLTPDIIGKNCLDLFAGSGILGLEALSRGAQRVTFVEKNRDAFRQLQKSCQQLKIAQADIIHGDYTKALAGSYDIIFLDPPYALRLLPQLLDEILLLSPRYVFVEDNQPIADWVEKRGDYDILKSKKAGSIYYGLLSPHQA